MIADSYGRVVDNMRISITQRCNLECIYCHKEGESGAGNDEMSVEEITRITRIASKIGIKNIKITGGEPLLREDITEIVRQISGLPNIEEVSMTTNGTLLSIFADKLKKAGLKRVNISLDTLDPEKFSRITGGRLNHVIEGVKSAAKANLTPIKMNMVLLKGINDNEVWDMIGFAGKLGIILQVIEFVPLAASFSKYHVNLQQLEEELVRRSEDIKIRNFHRRRKYFLSPCGEVETVKPVHNSEFCMGCRRIRLTSDGKLKPCLMRSDNLVDILSPLRGDASDKELKELFLKAIDLREPYYAG
ncbi:MAG: GTP 3',8-cyclase MoaA [Promethearchaeota archaeon]